MKPHSILVTGEPKHIQSFLQCISFGPKDEVSHRYTAADRSTEKVLRMHFGTLEVDEDNRLDFYGTNEDHFFEFVSLRDDIQLTGIVTLLDADQQDPLQGFASLMVEHMKYLRRYALVIGVCGQSYRAIKVVEQRVRETLTELDAVAPVFSIDPSNKEEVSLLVESLLCFVNPGLHDTSKGKSQFIINE